MSEHDNSREAARETTVHAVPFDRRLALILGFNLVLFFICLFDRPWGIGLTLFEILHLLPHLWKSFTQPHKRPSALTLTKAGLAVVLSAGFWTHTYEMLQFVTLLTLIPLNISVIYELETGQLMPINYLLKTLNISIGKVMFYTQQVFAALTLWQKDVKRIASSFETRVLQRIIVGLVIAVPLLFLFVILFSSADQNFETLITNIWDHVYHIFDFLKWFQHFDQVFSWLFQFGLFWVYLCTVMPSPWELTQKAKTWRDHLIEKLTVAASVAGIFALFIWTQFKSIGDVLHGFQTAQINPAQYVREGFAQLVISCAIGLAIFLTLKKDVEMSPARRLLRVAFYTACILLVEIVLVACVAGERVWLYQYEFGLTRIRIWGMLGLLYLFIVIATLFSEFFQRITKQMSWQMFAIGLASVILLANIINIDRAVATWKPPVVNGKVDVDYMRTLSSDAVPFWINQLRGIDGKTLADCPDAKGTCEQRLETLKDQYQLAIKMPEIVDESLSQGYREKSDGSKEKIGFCDKNTVDHFLPQLSYNLAQINNRQLLCSHLDEWKNFVQKYESLHDFYRPTDRALQLKVLNIVLRTHDDSPQFEPSTQATLIANAMAEASKYKGQGESAITYKIVSTETELEGQGTQPPYLTINNNTVDYSGLFGRFNICSQIQSGAIDEVWVWTNGKTKGIPLFAMKGPHINSGNSQMPDCGKTVTIMNLNYNMLGPDQLWNFGQRMDFVAMNTHPEEYKQFSTYKDSEKVTGFTPKVISCGTYMTPPNTSKAWDYVQKSTVASDCEGWTVQHTNPPKDISCDTWGCNNRGYLNWWLQHIPGINNDLQTITGRSLTNWWYAFGKYDDYLAKNQ